MIAPNTMNPHAFPNPLNARHAANRGAAFVIALLVVTILAAVALVFAREMRVESYSSTNQVAHAQARWIALGALDAVRGEIAADLAAGLSPRLDTTGDQAVALGGGLYWVIRPNHEDEKERAFGLTSEAGKINLNTAGAEMLAALPEMNESIAAAIIDWRDIDGDVTEGGAEAQYYLTRPEGYNAKNGPFETAGELLLVRGMERSIFDGEDANRNGVLDLNEDDGSENAPEDNSNGQLDFGLIDYLTVYTAEPNTSITGEERLNVNAQGGQSGQQLAQFLRDELGEERGNEVLAIVVASPPFANTLDFYVKTKLTEDEFAKIHDRLTTDQGDVLAWRIDVYHASAAVLNAIPALEEGGGELIVASRPELIEGEAPPSLAWLVDVLEEEKAVEVANSLTTRSFQFTADIVAVSGDGRGVCRLTAVIDAAPREGGEGNSGGGSGGLPRVIRIKDQTALGWPLEQEVLEALRRGEAIEDVASAYGAAAN